MNFEQRAVVWCIGLRRAIKRKEQSDRIVSWCLSLRATAERIQEMKKKAKTRK